MRAVGGAALLLCAACTPEFRVVGDPTQPLDLDLGGTGAPTTRVRGQAAIAIAALDTGSPVSTLSSSAGCAPTTPLVLQSAAAPDRERLAFPDLHPYCVDGDSVVGGDLLAHYEAIFAGDRCGGGGALACLQLLQQEVQSTRALAEDGFAVLSFRLLGGGQLVDGGGRTLSWPATRVPLRVCVNPPQQPGDPPGIDVTLLVATGRAPLVLTESTMARTGLVAALPIERLVLVGHTLGGAVQDPGPCGELERALCLNQIDPRAVDRDSKRKACEMMVLTDQDSWDNSADVGAFVTLDGPISIAAIADDDPYIQAARNEVRPRISDVDGLLGAEVLNRLEQVRIDYLGVAADDIDSGTRVITRCRAADPSCRLSTRHAK